MEIQDLIIYQKTIAKREGCYADFPARLSAEIGDFLSTRGITRLYSHQAEMFEAAQAQKNIVITTTTASGKTLSFLLPVLQEILSNPTARAIFVYPTKALASDQYRALVPYLEYFGENRISAGVYDGDTPVNERSRIRKNANIILTNPEMLNSAFLSNHSKFGFDFIFANLKYLVIDELHTYRGAFGSHLANVFRRFKRICRYYHSAPQYLCSSATIANPLELAQGICGQPFIQIDQDGSPAAQRTYLLVQPPRIVGRDQQDLGQLQPTTIAANLIPDLVEGEHNFIAFAKSRKNVEIVLKESRDNLETESFFGPALTDKISGYRGGYTPLERKEIEKKMITGAIRGLVSTNALELGIDIGNIDTTVLVGYPGTRASFWQQTGRAGRCGKDCTNYLILDNQPFDQYIAINPDWLFESSSENAVIDPNNLLIQLAHIRAAAAEIPLTLDDIALFPDLGETIPVLLRAHELTSQNGKFAWTGQAFPAGDFSLRNIDQSRYKLINQENNQEITEMDEMQAFRELHQGAIYMHDGVLFEVIRLNLESHTAFAIPFNGNYYTMPGSHTQIRIIAASHELNEKQIEKRINGAFGDVNVNEMVYMYKKLQFHNHQNLGYEQFEKPLAKDYDTESTWINLPANVVSIYRRLIQWSQNGQIIQNNHFEGVAYAIKNATMMATMTEREDIGVTVSNNAIDLGIDSDEDVYLYLYDRYIGGLGYAEKAFDLILPIINNAIRMVSGCPCEQGCAACIGDYHLDKSLVLWGLRNFLAELALPKGIKLTTSGLAPAVPVIKKPFGFDTLPENWPAFCDYLLRNGERFGSFLSTVMAVEVDGQGLTLVLDQDFYREWVMDASNKKSLINLFSYYTDAPTDLKLAIRIEELRVNPTDKRKKLQRRYENLIDTKIKENQEE
ncbi:DEAD/DEAH box helicase [Acetobacterium woodii]|uniref:Putative ATP-dependent helicase n=1 Tax=Acetobacterium woodii (strain ATCC 29683 / DSM 1030 / JCM 2381 / KCTC 1655 / WB1) TaxID=931626 RepID=H6LIK8_ACEWD|nr:DEAD/DEAH box helicase [Acetobacterium woodii]AFA48582.1 putative ATP-dependent helicase [Acetobacterium woodii DSM 1030]